jgi:hypothetical protein
MGKNTDISVIALVAFALHGRGPLTRCKTGARPVG